MEPPISPVPTTVAVGRAVPPDVGTGLFREVIAQPARSSEVDVVEHRRGRLDVHHHADAAPRCAVDIQFTSTKQRDVAKADRPGGRGWEHRMDVIGCREQH